MNVLIILSLFGLQSTTSSAFLPNSSFSQGYFFFVPIPNLPRSLSHLALTTRSVKTGMSQSRTMKDQSWLIPGSGTPALNTDFHLISLLLLSRFDCRGVFRLSLCAVSLDPPKFWVAQANHIFAQLQTSSHFQNYVCVRDITFILQLVPNTYNTQEPEGYLFVCPPEHFRAGLDSLQWPTCPAYWSLDPSGAARLSTEDAKILGFPLIHIETRAFRYSWDGGVYDGLRRFHQGRGFDPESQEAALYLGYPLYKLSNDKVLFACVEGWQECDLEDTAPCEEFGHYLE
ncbi:hypothetical protein B0H14DRAFT_1332868 [Mycena olivaceomarginata]|nr:hypothetical protein B0H14DRAFT_1332868 [Mycena olivaceomarginata]